jgi:hypothetical protein
MGLWGKLAGIGLGVAGVVTGNPGLIVAGASVLGNSMAGDGVNRAADQQVAAAEKAQGQADQIYGDARREQRGIYENSLAAFQPYQALGTGSVRNLGGLVGLPANFMDTQATPVNATAAPIAEAAEAPATDTAAPIVARRQQAASSYQGKREGMDRDLGRMGGLVLLRAPTGETRRLPMHLADQAIAKGAQVVG